MPRSRSAKQNLAASAWYILGAGAIGCLWAASLQQQNIRATLVVRDEKSIDLYNTNGGLSLNRDQQTVMLAAELVTPTQIDQPISRLIVATKAQHTLEALASIADNLADDATILLLQNGMGQQQAVVEQYPSTQLYCGISTDGAYVASPFNIIHAGAGNTVIGRFPEQLSNDRQLTALLDDLPNQQLSLETSHHIEPLLLKKVLINTLINPLTAVHQCRNGDLLALPDVYLQLQQLAAEVDQVTRAAGHYHAVGSALELAREVATATANNRSSMLQDRQAGRRTEIDYILGYFCRLAEKNNIATPLCDALLNMVRQWPVNDQA